MRGGTCVTVFVVGLAFFWLLGGVCLCAGCSGSGAIGRAFVYVGGARVYVRFSGGFGMWRVWPSFRSCLASSAVMTRPQMGGHFFAYLPPAHTARSCWASCGADTGLVVCLLSGLV